MSVRQLQVEGRVLRVMREEDHARVLLSGRTVELVHVPLTLAAVLERLVDRGVCISFSVSEVGK